ncbi:TonB-dependent receptor (plasmid) [Croceibacterium sp. TMG7-5b_MA50]|uniref:TonB-dependent receptor n=1 Tax=Croceibacterium sp. TMG7-5b_MA50 TaxID=3121290 RepID=UPI0032213AF4
MYSFKRRLGRSAAVALALVAVGAAAQAQAQSQQAQQRTATIDIAAGPLATALEQLARQSGTDVLFTQANVATLRAPALRGSMDAQSAARRLLAGTALTVVRDRSGALIVRPTAAAAGNAAGSGPGDQSADTGAGAAASAVAAEGQDDAIVVTARFSDGVDRSLEVKRKADSISDAVVAADIGKLPAMNVAEALQRVPGVTIVREAGEGQFISVRGLGPNFQAVTFDGMPLAYNENIRNSGQSGRQFRLQVLPATLIDSIVVIKSPTADLVETGVGSTVDIWLINPLDRDSFFAANAYVGYEERTDTVNPNGTLSGGWRNADETFGVLAGISYSKREVQFDRLRGGWVSADVPGLGSLEVPGDMQPYLEQENRERISGVLGLQWRPASNLELDVDGLYSQFNNETYERRLTYYIPTQLSRLDLGSAVVEDGRLVAGTIRGGRIRNYSEYLDQRHENLQVNARLRWELGDWRIEPRVSYARATSDLDTPISRVQYRTANGRGGNLTFDFSNDVADDARINALYTDLDLTNPALMPFESFTVRPINSRDEDKTAVIDITRELYADLAGLQLTSIKVGGQISNRYRDYQRRDRSGTVLRDGVQRTGAFLSYPAPGNAFDQSIDRFQNWATVDWNLFGKSYTLGSEWGDVSPDADDLAPTAADLQNSYRIDEDITAAYVRADFEAAFGDVPMTGNVGLRFIRTETGVQGTTVAPVTGSNGAVTTEVTPSLTGAAYEEWLPSLNASFELRPNMLLRLAAGRTMTRPSLSELRNSINTNSVTVANIFAQGAAALADDTLDLTAAGGNPNLMPYTSWNLDASFEWYFEEFGGFTVAAFHKEISDYIASDFEVRNLAFAVRDGSTVPVDILVATPVNVGDATITGIELGYTNRLPIGLGLTATATFATSKLELDLTDAGVQSAGMQGVSDTSFSITPFFEHGPFEINVSYTWRSAYQTDAGALVTSLPVLEDVEAFYQDGFGIVDLGTSYQVVPNMELFGQVVNLLNSRQVSYAGTRDRFSEIHTFGRTVNVGVRAKF